jgi:hypothetical protein
VTSHLAGFYQSLHLNLGECYRKLGDLDRAREQFERGQAAVGSLGDDGYGQMINGGLDRGQTVRPCSSDATRHARHIAAKGIGELPGRMLLSSASSSLGAQHRYGHGQAFASSESNGDRLAQGDRSFNVCDDHP